MYKVFIDGSAGTTGLRIHERLSERTDIELLKLDEQNRKDPVARAEMLNSCDIAFLCLPDDASRQAVSMIENKNVVVIDTSTAHRTLPDWAYGFPELSGEHLDKIKSSNRIAVPGCYASGFISLVQPLVKNKILPAASGVYCHAMSGYSGAGKKGIAQYQDKNAPCSLQAPREYALTQQHKHIKEMKIISGLDFEPIFVPYVCNYYCGMSVTVPIFKKDLASGAFVEDIKKIYKETYNGDIVKYTESMDENGFISSNVLANNDGMQISVFGNDERILLVSRFDNLGKGASGAAVECMNIKMSVCATTGLNL